MALTAEQQAVADLAEAMGTALSVVSTEATATSEALSATNASVSSLQTTVASIAPVKLLASTDPLPAAPSAPVICLRMST